MGSGRLKIISIAFLILLILGASALWGVYYYINNIPTVSEDRVVDIPKGKGLRNISALLKNEGIIGSGEIFVLYVIGKGWQEG
jgi:cell division protein YceG involved in septum cleavage